MRTLARFRMLAALLLVTAPALAATPAAAASLSAAQPVAALAAPILAATPADAAEAPALAAVPRDVNDFTFDSFDARYDLGMDDAGHSTLRTTETFVAQFPESDQNRGIQRAIPRVYQGHPTDLELVSVTDGDGTPREYETEDDDENLVVTIAGDDYVHGEQTYVLTYTQRDVTAYFANTDDDEFYWDTNGTLWKQPFAEHRTTTVVAPELVDALTGDTGCFVGVEGSTAQCEIVEAQGDPTAEFGTDTGSDTGSGSGGAVGIDEAIAEGAAVFTTDTQNLTAGENVTIGVAFAPHTFTERETGYLSAPSGWIQLVAVVLAIATAIAALVHRLTRLRDAKGRPVIVPEYTPPRGEDLLIASVVTKRTNRAAAASFVDYAVRRVLQIVEQSEPGLFGPSTQYWLQLKSADPLNPHERELAAALFGPGLAPGSWRELKKKDAELAKAIYALLQKTRKRARTEGYLGRSVTGIGSLLLIAAIVLAAVGFVAGIVTGEAGLGGGLPFLLVALLFVLMVFTGIVAFRTPLTQKGAELRDYVAGIEMYLKWAEEERFRVLQSPEGALRTGVDAPDWGQVVKLYEKLLPYAVLLNLETEWAKVLGTYYESLGSQPDWYGGSSTFNAALFASSLSSLSSTSASAYSGSSSSSSSGFSGGGGSSGGGGGGGGGGGV
ncbi:DUF2207 family protein [Herbiconiux flava]|uniref:Putative membrane protein YgcG n=1 Tax=Herbiconiux flava TaxID=881268 RepID=A0A852SLV2_9MICO|nr:DUF2207 domain-containing protein [Herbiconiux flava]NYD69479.1 putative membrane protein YgcG [Herbiconiux flava]GLK16224.1 hypothetical protein GCM10017602_07060 [Herbiconiux flava]